MKRFLLIPAIAMLAIGSASAQTAPASAPSSAPKYKRLADVEAELKLTPAQEPLWQAFTVSLRGIGRARYQAYQQSKGAPADLPSRLVQQAEMMAAEQKAAQAETDALTPLWAQLNDQQKSILNAEITVGYRRTVRSAKAEEPKPTAP